jgi:hypothetical protein
MPSAVLATASRTSWRRYWAASAISGRIVVSFADRGR